MGPYVELSNDQHVEPDYETFGLTSSEPQDEHTIDSVVDND